jgi:hypothetical protein
MSASAIFSSLSRSNLHAIGCCGEELSTAENMLLVHFLSSDAARYLKRQRLLSSSLWRELRQFGLTPA